MISVTFGPSIISKLYFFLERELFKNNNNNVGFLLPFGILLCQKRNLFSISGEWLFEPPEPAGMK